MAWEDKGQVISLKADSSLEKGRLVYVKASGTVAYCTANTHPPIGVTADSANSSGSVPVIISGVAKIYAYTSITAGELVCMETNTSGMCKHAHTDDATIATTNISVVGVALESGSNSSLIPVVLQIKNPWSL